MKKYVLVLAATFLLIASAAITDGAYEGRQITAVKTTGVTVKNIQTTLTCKGRIEENSVQNIYLPATARIDAVYVQPGDFVNKGEALFAISPAGADAIPEATEVFAQYYAEKLASIQSVNDLQTLLEGDLSDEARQVYYSADISGDTNAEVKSPVSGIVTKINVTEKGYASPAIASLCISDTSAIYVKIDLPEAYVQKVNAGQEVTITGEAFKGRSYSGVVMRTMPFAEKTGSLLGSGETVVRAIVKVINPDAALLPGCTANAKIVTGRKNDTLTIPYEAITQDNDGNEYVFAVHEGVAYKREIKTGSELEDCVEVTSGIKKSMVLVLNPPDNLYNGARVKPEEGRQE